jgi:hypothetical protein
MSTAPRDGTLVRLRLKDGADFVGYYSTKWFGWVDYDDPLPLIRGDIAFLGWSPTEQGERLIRLEPNDAAAPVPTKSAAAVVVTPGPVLANRIVTARKPGRRR